MSLNLSAVVKYLLVFTAFCFLTSCEGKMTSTAEVNQHSYEEDGIAVPLTYLALGDSYTIGEGVPEEDRWPNQFGREVRTRIY